MPVDYNSIELTTEETKAAIYEAKVKKFFANREGAFGCKCGAVGDKLEGNGHTASCNFENRKRAKDESKIKIVKPIKKVSVKQAEANKKYYGPAGTKEQHLKEHPDCQIKLMGCTNRGIKVPHHVAKRGKNLNNLEHLLTACIDCHEFIETVMSAEERRKMGFLK